ncbi:hypothetical protein LTR62_006922 [Meristemomyces frigidus]|uniref:Zn(2)-C6 fungal-type domain-containing protein n=1 Tax=Meristemomyces frigidus TaxID=1508187 RepID=A0AAN7YE74_9PEZI|nr:hypothetical protein LTR62_006922 [Meristemomyces frigidus]
MTSQQAASPTTKSPIKRKSSETATPATTSDQPSNGRSLSHSHSTEKKENKSASAKRRKVNHACVYCRRSHMTCDLERPCARCMKRDIGHLCHDEPREGARRSRSEIEVELATTGEKGELSTTVPVRDYPRTTSSMGGEVGVAAEAGEMNGTRTNALGNTGSIGGAGQMYGGAAMGVGMNGHGSGHGQAVVEQTPISPTRLSHNSITYNERPASQQRQQSTINIGNNPNTLPQNNDFATFDWSNTGVQNQFQDMHHLHPNYMFNTSEVTNEYNLLNDFLSTSLLDDGALFSPDDAAQTLFSDPLLTTNSLSAMQQSTNSNYAMPPPQQQQQAQQIQHQQPHRQSSQHHPHLQPKPSVPFQPQTAVQDPTTIPNTDPTNKSLTRARENYFLTAADPTGNSSAQARLHSLLKAKHDAGMLKPFNYVKGYARLQTYMKTHLTPIQQRRILDQLGRFRPGFRAAMQGLSDLELVMVEMWFERSLMEYDRVFASMAIPACCWRRTGEIFRGNREMAALLGLGSGGLERLRGGGLALHEVLEGESLVSYWEKFGAVAFDGRQKGVLTSCTLKTQEGAKEEGRVKCCFSFTIRRDGHNIPSLIVGNFLPIKPKKAADTTV